MPDTRPISTLEHVIARFREHANELRFGGHKIQAESVDAVLDAVSAAAEDYLVFLDERAAGLRSGRSTAWLKARYDQWERDGHARMRGGRREYRTLIVPQAVNLISAREAGRAAARKPAA